MFREDTFSFDDLQRVLSADDDDIEAAKYYAAMADRRLFEYHLTIKSFAGHATQADAGVFTQMLECALREADSVNEPESGSTSFIGAWGAIYAHLMDNEHNSLWCKIHCDTDTSVFTEEDHAKDAREILSRLVRGVAPIEFIRSLKIARQLHAVRLTFWDTAISDVKRVSEMG